MKKIYIFIILFCSLKFISAQNIQFPQSFKLENSYFIEPLLDSLPQNSQTKGFEGNPGIITDTLTLKRLQSDYKEVGIEAIYYQYYGTKTASSALHVIKYKNVAKREAAMKDFEASDRAAYLALDVYIIMIGIVEEESRDEQIDNIVQFYQQKLGAELFLARLENFEAVAQQTQTIEEEKPKNRTDYQKLSEKEMKRFFEMETKTHKLGRVSFNTYSNDNKTYIDTSYDVENGKLLFNNEYVYKYDDKDSLIYESQYSEIPSAEYPEFMEDKYTYHDTYSVRTRSFDGKIQDSVFTYYFRNNQNLIEREIEFTKSSSGNFKFSRDSIFTVYTHDKFGNITSKKAIGDRYQKEYKYEYLNEKLKKKSFIADHYVSEEIYDENGKLIEETNAYPYDESLNFRSVFIYNKKGWLVRRDTYKNGKIFDKYKYINDNKGREIKYEMGKENGIWLYEYDDQDRVKYKIDLYSRKEKPVENETMMTMPAPVATD